MPVNTGTWTALYPTLAEVNSNIGITGYTARSRIKTAFYNAGAPATGVAIRVTVGGGGVTSNTVSDMYCGHAAASPAFPQMDYDGSQVPIRFGGLASVALPSAATLVSDVAWFNFDKTKDIVCSSVPGSQIPAITGSGGANLTGTLSSFGLSIPTGVTDFPPDGLAGWIYGPMQLIEVLH